METEVPDLGPANRLWLERTAGGSFRTVGWWSDAAVAAASNALRVIGELRRQAERDARTIVQPEEQELALAQARADRDRHFGRANAAEARERQLTIDLDTVAEERDTIKAMLAREQASRVKAEVTWGEHLAELNNLRATVRVLENELDQYRRSGDELRAKLQDLIEAY